MTQIVLEGKTPSAAMDGINWGGATADAVETFAISFFLPTGTATAAKVAKLGKSKVGKLTMSFSKNLVKTFTENYFNGKYDDEDGDFDFDKVEADFENLLVDAALQTFLDGGEVGKANELYSKLSKENKALSAKYSKYFNKANNGASAKNMKNYGKKVADQEKKVVKEGKEAVKKDIIKKLKEAPKEVIKDKLKDEGKKKVLEVTN